MVSTQSNRKIRKRIGRHAHSRRSAQDKNTLRTPAPVRLGFLSQQFQPLMELEQCPKQWQKMQREFFTSAQHFSRLYGIGLPDISNETFPFDVAMSYDHFREELVKKHPDTALLIVQDDSHHACLATSQTCDTGNTLFYIPVQPLYYLLRMPDKRKVSQLLISIFAYLYQIVDIPFFTEQTFTQMMYCDTRSWIFDNEQEWDKKSLTAFRKDFGQLFREGKIIRAKLAKPFHLCRLSKRCQDFLPTSVLEEQLLQVGNGFNQLYQNYPQRSIHDNMLEISQSYDDDETISAKEYISFVWATDDFIFENFSENINMYFQEKRDMQEPTAIQYFDQPQQAIQHDLQFESRLFDLLHDLSNVLNTIA